MVLCILGSPQKIEQLLISCKAFPLCKRRNSRSLAEVKFINGHRNHCTSAPIDQIEDYQQEAKKGQAGGLEAVSYGVIVVKEYVASNIRSQMTAD